MIRIQQQQKNLFETPPLRIGSSPATRQSDADSSNVTVNLMAYLCPWSFTLRTDEKRHRIAAMFEVFKPIQPENWLHSLLRILRNIAHCYEWKHGTILILDCQSNVCVWSFVCGGFKMYWCIHAAPALCIDVILLFLIFVKGKIFW